MLSFENVREQKKKKKKADDKHRLKSTPLSLSFVVQCSLISGECARNRQVTCQDSVTGKEATSCAVCLKPNEYQRCPARFCRRARAATSGSGDTAGGGDECGTDESFCNMLPDMKHTHSEILCKTPGRFSEACCRTCLDLGHTPDLGLFEA